MAATDPSALNLSQRERDFERMTTESFDVVVIGGGVTGAGVALDAASRGLGVALVEQRDYASGTSSRSSKLFHGGLRYLEQLNFKLVREALSERNLMVGVLCPHLASPVSFVYPLENRIWERLYVGTGIFVYDLMARRSGSTLPHHEHVGREELARIAPALDPEKAWGAVRYWDALVDDARHTVTLARTAARHGAALTSSTRVTGFVEARGMIRRVEAVDLETGADIQITTRAVINATGVWSDDIQGLARGRGLDVRASKGIHLVVPKARISSETGIILRTEASVLLVIPWGEHWIVGTTDTPWALGRAHPAASRSDIDYLLQWVNSVVSTPLTHDDIVGVYAGLRPLLAGESEETSMLSREHAVMDSGKGMISVAGGKYTTYRVMARDAVDAVAQYLDRPLPSSRTHEMPLVGAEGLGAARASPAPPGMGADDHQRLLGRYGSRIGDLIHLLQEEPELTQRIVDDAPYLWAEMIYASTHEGALHLDDALTRRTRISIETRHRGTLAAQETARLMGGVLGWSRETSNREIEHYKARVEAELDSQRQPDDRTADAARMGAPDVRTGTAE